jgi:proteasome accessory factor C
VSPRQRTTADAQLERILYILPRAARDGGASVADLAHELGVDRKRVLDDIAEATARCFHHPGGVVEPFSVLFTRREVRVDAQEHFKRPTRLNEREALTLGLGLRALAADATSDERRAEILELATRLEAALRVADAHGTGAATASERDGVEYEAEEIGLSLGSDRFRGEFADAIERGVTCAFSYLKAGGGAPEPRRLAPYRLIHASGHWYVAGLDMERNGLRFFRLDRVLDAEATSEPAPAEPARFQDWVAGAPYRADDEEEVTVIYDAVVAPWVCEACGLEPEQDGSVVVRHRVADRRWIVRHVLQYGGAATIADPPPVREAIARAAAACLG